MKVVLKVIISSSSLVAVVVFFHVPIIQSVGCSTCFFSTVIVNALEITLGLFLLLTVILEVPSFNPLIDNDFLSAEISPISTTVGSLEIASNFSSDSVG